MNRYKVEIKINQLKHSETVNSATTHNAVKKVATSIKGLISKLECITPTAEVFEEIGGWACYGC